MVKASRLFDKSIDKILMPFKFLPCFQTMDVVEKTMFMRLSRWLTANEMTNVSALGCEAQEGS